MKCLDDASGLSPKCVYPLALFSHLISYINKVLYILILLSPSAECLLYFPDHMSCQVTRGPGQGLSLVWVSPSPLIGRCNLSQVCFAKISGLISYWGPNLVPYWLANTVLSTRWPLQPVVSGPGLLLAVIPISRSPIGWLHHRHKCLTKCSAHVPSATLTRASVARWLHQTLYQDK